MANHRTKVLCGAAVLAMGFICITYSKRAHPVKPEYAKDLSIHMALDAADKINNHLRWMGPRGKAILSEAYDKPGCMEQYI